MPTRSSFPLSLLLVLLAALPLSAQILTVDPPLPTPADEVTITFDASQGTQGLKDCACDVYIHTGLITENSANSADWQYVNTTWGEANDDWKLEPVPGEANKYTYTIGPSIRAYYGAAAGERIDRMAFVFRDATGDREGKDSGGADIFYEVQADEQVFTTVLQQPQGRYLVVEKDQAFAVEAVASQEATFELFRGDQLLDSATGISFSSQVTAGDFGNFDLRLRISAGEEADEYAIRYVVPTAKAPADPPAGARPGAEEVAESTLRLLLPAPGKQRVFVLGDFNGWELDTAYEMRASSEGSFWIEIDGIQAGKTYRYQYLIDENLVLADPYSTLVLDPAHDEFIPASVYPDLPAYPEDTTTGLVSVVQPGAPAYDWATDAFAAPPAEELVVYELVLRDFLAAHSYTALIDTLSYLDRLGVNAIQLMPVSEFEGNISWGYNPSFHNAVDKYYGTANEFKRLVDSAHHRGIAVILDVVYNHAFSQSPLVRMFWDAANSRPSPENPWFNPVPLHPFAVGHDFDHSYPGTRQYVKSGLERWLDEFRIDGFRFDQSKGFTQRQSSGLNEWARYDPQRVAWIQEYADFVWSINPDAYVILEHFADAQEEKILTDYGMMSWAGGLHDQYKEAAMGYASNLSGASWKFLGWSGPQLMAYMESHDEERMMYKNLQFGNSDGAYNVRDFATALDRVALAASFFYTIPGPKMLWQFGELGYEISRDRCVDGSIREGCNIDPKPIRWDYLEDQDRVDLFNEIKDLIYLKTAFEAFNTDDFDLVLNRSDWKKIFLRDPEMDVAVLGNFDVRPTAIPDPFPSAGKWYEFFSGDSLQVSDPAAPLNLEAGAYRLYTTQRISRPRGISTSTYEVVRDYFGLQLYPNPTTGPLRVRYRLDQAAAVRLEVFNLYGQRLAVPWEGRLPAGPQEAELGADLPPGTYLLRLTAGRRMESKLFVKQ